MKMASLNEQMDIISVGIEEIVPQEQLESQLSKSIKNNQPLRVKFGSFIATLLIGGITGLLGSLSAFTFKLAFKDQLIKE